MLDYKMNEIILQIVCRNLIMKKYQQISLL